MKNNDLAEKRRVTLEKNKRILCIDFFSYIYWMKDVFIQLVLESLNAFQKGNENILCF